MARRVAVTGMGTVNACGTGGTAAVMESLDRGRSAIAPATFPPDGSPSRLAAQVAPDTLGSLIGAEPFNCSARFCTVTAKG